MKAKVISIKESQSKSHPGHVLWIFFKGKDGKSYKTFLSRSFSNWNRWMAVVSRFRFGPDAWLDGLRVLNEKKRLIDAGSLFKTVQGG